MPKIHTEHNQYIRKSFRIAYDFYEAHKLPRARKDWDELISEANTHSDTFTLALLAAVTDELEREYHQNKPPA